MKALLLWLLTALIVLGQAVLPDYPYPIVLPDSGSILGTTVKTERVLNPYHYEDPWTAVWGDFIGGGYRSVESIAERDSIVAGRRKEGMLVWVKADSRLYILGSDLTSWSDVMGPFLAEASSDATSKSSAAQSAAIASAALDASGKAATAQAAAIATSAADATSKAASAQSGAISAASTDATITSSSLLDLSTFSFLWVKLI